MRTAVLPISTSVARREAELTHILDPPAGSDNVHPTDAGYALIAGQIQAQAVPEPGTALILGAGLLALLGRGRRRARAA